MSISSPSPPPDGGYVPPGAPAKRPGPGCWVWGFMGCLVVFIIIAGMVALSVYKLSKTKEGKELFGSIGTAMKSTQSLAMCEQKMKIVNAAIGRYHDHTGHYPPNLKALSPNYLSDSSALHCADIDSNPNPTHVSFAYTRPADNAPSDTHVLSFHWKYMLGTEDNKNNIDTEIIMLLNGNILTNQTRSIDTGPGGVHTTTTTTTTEDSSPATTAGK